MGLCRRGTWIPGVRRRECFRSPVPWLPIGRAGRAPGRHRHWRGSHTSAPRSLCWLQCFCPAQHHPGMPAKVSIPAKGDGDCWYSVSSQFVLLLGLTRSPQPVWFLTLIPNQSVLMTFITDNETYSVYSTTFSKVIWDLSQSFCLQATKQSNFLNFFSVCFPNAISHCYIYSTHSNEHFNITHSITISDIQHSWGNLPSPSSAFLPFSPHSKWWTF